MAGVLQVKRTKRVEVWLDLDAEGRAADIVEVARAFLAQEGMSKGSLRWQETIERADQVGVVFENRTTDTYTPAKSLA